MKADLKPQTKASAFAEGDEGSEGIKFWVFGAYGHGPALPGGPRAARLVPWPGLVRAPFPVLQRRRVGDLRKKCSRASPSPGRPAGRTAGASSCSWRARCSTTSARAPGPFASRRAFMYVLELLAQVLPVITFARRLPLHWLAFIDNVAGQFALMKGYGRDPAVNGILAAFWGLGPDRAWCPEFYRVPSAFNVSDAISVAILAQASGLKSSPEW